MPARPRLSLCIPTYNRADFCRGALESGLREVATQPPGTVEFLVCDNASTDQTWAMITALQAEHPELRALRNSENLGFDLNYFRCVEEARGEFVWILGDDDVWLPGSITQVLGELDAGADACLCLSEACDLDMKPVVVLPWYLEENPPEVWHLEDREDLIRYFNACARTAGVFAFISVAIFRRDRFLEKRESLQQAVGMGYPHLWGMMEFLRQPTELHYIPQALIQNRMSDLHSVSYANTNLYGRWMQDLMSWTQIAEAVFGDDPDIQDAFSRIIGRNHHNTILPGLRRCAPTEPEWLHAVPYLRRAGFSAIQIAAVDFSFQHMYGDRLPMPTLDPVALCLADIQLVARGARHIAVLALGGLANILAGAGLLAALRSQGGAGRVRIYGPAGSEELLDGFAVQCLDPKRYSADEAYRAPIIEDLLDFAPELIVNLDPERGIEADDLVASALPAAAIAFELPARGQDADLVKALNTHYTCLLPRRTGPEAMAEALGLEEVPAELWPIQAALEETRGVLFGLGWEPAKTLVVLVDHASIPADPGFQSAFAHAAGEGWTFVGVGGRATYQLLEDLLGPLEGRAVNLAGGLRLASMAALLQQCGGYLGGTQLLQSMARACACAPYPPASPLPE